VHPPLEVARRHRHSVLYRDDERSTFSPMCLSVRQRPKRSAPTDAAMIRDGRVQVLVRRACERARPHTAVRR
jgi:hypothetical protein